MPPINLLESVKLAADRGETQRAAVIQTFRAESDLLRTMPILTIRGGAYTYNQEAAMPGIAFRGVNEGYTASHAVFNPQVEPLKIAGGTLDVDRAILAMHGEQVGMAHRRAKVKALARQISFTLIEGVTTVTNSKEVSGLKERVPTGGTQALQLASTAALSCKALDELIQMVDEPTHLLMNRATVRNLTAFTRSGGTGAAAVEIMQDDFGRQIPTYAGLPILIADRNGEIAALPFTEASSTASLFVLSIGMDTYHLIQNGEIVTELPELNDDRVTTRSLVEWYVGQALPHPRAVARGHNFTNVTAVA